MAERKAISKALRFEVFKRDHFTCQYCGRMAPDVILEVDHIKPVAKGGDNDILNLVTSCRDCNRGKGKKLISQNDALKKSQKELLELAEKTEQAQMMVDWKNELLETRIIQADSVAALIESLTGLELIEKDKQIILKQIIEFNYPLVYEAAEIAFMRYYKAGYNDYQNEKSLEYALSRIGGICYNKRRGGAENGNL